MRAQFPRIRRHTRTRSGSCRLGVVAVLTAALLTMTLPAVAEAAIGIGTTQSGSLAYVGGGGGAPFGPNSCASGQVMAGLNGWDASNNTFMQGIQGRCFTVRAVGSTLETTFVTTTASAPGGRTNPMQSYSCPSGSFMTGGVLGRVTSGETYIDYVIPRCRTATLNTTTLAITWGPDTNGTKVGVDSTGGSLSAQTVDCPVGQIAGGFAGRSGAGLDGFNLVCYTLTYGRLGTQINVVGGTLTPADFTMTYVSASAGNIDQADDSRDLVTLGTYTFSAAPSADYVVTNSDCGSGSVTSVTINNLSDLTCTHMLRYRWAKLSKAFNPTTINVGTTNRLTFTLTNEGALNHTGLGFVDTLPANLRVAATPNLANTCGGTVTAAAGSGSVTLSGGVMSPATSTCTIAVDITNAPTATTSIACPATNSTNGPSNVTVTSPVIKDASFNTDASSGCVTIVADADLAITATSPTVTPGASGATVTLTATNNGPSPAVNPTITWTMPTGLQLDGALPSGCTQGTGPSANVITCQSSSTVANGGTYAPVINVRVPANASPGTFTDGTATVSSTTPDSVSANNTTSNGYTIGPPVSDLAVSTVTTPTITPGGTGVQRVTVANNGPSDTTAAATLTYNPPVGASITALPAGCTGPLPTGPLSCTVPAGFTSTGFDVSLSYPPSATAGPRAGNAISVAAGSGDTDNNSSNNATVGPAVVGPGSANVSHVKSIVTDPIVAGRPVVYRMVITNAGPSDANNVKITDTLDARLTFRSNIAGDDTTSSAGCSANGQNVTCIVGTVAPGTPVTVFIAGRLDPAATGVVSNTSRLVNPTGPNCTADPSTEPSCSSTVGPNNITARADVTQVKTQVTNPIVPGRPVVYQVRVTNNGPSTARGVKVLDTLAAPLAFRANVAGDTTTSSPGCTAAGQDVTCIVGDMAVGATTDVLISGLLAADYTGTLGNTSRLVNPTGPDCVADPPVDPACSSVVPPAPVVPQANVTNVKTTVTNPVVAGAPVVWRIVVTNTGPSVATGVKVVDVLGAMFTFRPNVAGDATTSSAGCAAAGQTVTCTVGTVTVGTSITLFIAATLDATATTAVINTSRVVNPVGPTCTQDPPTGGACASTAGPDNVTRAADVRQVKSIVTDPVVAGQPVVYRIVVTNNGPSLARNVSVLDTLDSRLTFRPNVAGDATTSSAGCSAAGQLVTCAVGDVAVGAPVTVFIAGTLSSAATGTLSNTSRTVNPTGPRCVLTTDPDPSCTSTAGPDDITQRAAVTQTKTLVTSPVVAGRPVVWRVRVANAGPSVARNVRVLDTLASGLTFRPNVAGDDTTSSASCTATGQDVTCPLADLAVGATVDVFIAALLDTDATGTVSNTSRHVNPSGPSCTANPPTDPACSSTAGPDPVTAEADVRHTKTLTSAVVAGRPVVYRIVVTNLGPSTARNVRVLDTLDSRLTFRPNVSGDATTSSPECVAAGQAVTCTAPTVRVGQPVTFLIAGTLAANATGTLSNASQLVNPTGPSCTAPSNDPACGATAGPDDIGLEADVRHDKVLVTNPVIAGRPVVWNVTVTNNGPSRATNVRIVDTLGEGLTFRPHVAGDATTSSPECAASGQTVTCTVATLEVTSVILRIAALLDPDATGAVTNTANLINPTGPTCRIAGECVDTAGPDPIVSQADPRLAIDVASTDIDVTTSTPRTYTVTNSGPSTARNVTFSVPLPAGLGARGAPGANCTGTTTLVCTVGNVRPGATVTVPITLDGQRLGRHNAGAMLTSSTTDTNGANNGATTEVLVGATLSGRAWTDLDGTNTITGGEGASPATDVLLRTPDGTVRGLRIGPDGRWSTRVYVDGDYAVAYPEAGGFRPAALNASGNPAADAQTGFGAWTTVLSSGAAPRSVNAGYRPVADLLVMSFLDMNGNGRWDFEPLIPGSQSKVDRIGDETLAVGMRLHRDVLAAQHTVWVTEARGRTRTTPSVLGVPLLPGGLGLALFGFAPSFDVGISVSISSLNGNDWSPTLRTRSGRLQPNWTRSGDAVTWRVTVTNNGPDATGPKNVVTIPIPAFLTYRHHNSFWFGPCATVGSNFVCTTGTLAPGASATFEFCHVILGNPFADQFPMTVSVATMGDRVMADLQPGNNTATHVAPFFTWRNKRVRVPAAWRQYTPKYSTANGCRC